MSVLNRAYFQDETAALAHLESILWADGPECPHCGAVDRIYALKGAKTRPGLRKCGHCRKQFTVTVGTIFESSHVPLHKWLQAVHLFCCSKKGISAHQLHRVLECTYRTAWFMLHRLREAMRDGSLSPLGGIVEADETYFGAKLDETGQPMPKRRGTGHRRAVIALVERGGSVRSFHVDRADKATVQGIVATHIEREAHLMTDESHLYTGADVAGHETVCHSAEEYVRGDVHTNTIEGYFSIFKRGMKGVYQHCREKHLHRYLAEFDFRYNHRIARGVDDTARAAKALAGARGKRLTYRRADRP